MAVGQGAGMTTASGARGGLTLVPRSSAGGRVARWRQLMLIALSAGCVAAVAAALVVLIASVVMHDRYTAIVREGAVSVDAAQDARADILDSAGASADVLAQSGEARNTARDRASARYENFKEHLRESWQNRTDRAYGEFAAFDAADRASTEYAGFIGAMNVAVAANRADEARAAFLSAYDTLNQKLLPALGGLQANKVEFMQVRYASTSSTLRAWLIAVAAVSAALLLLALAGFWLTRRMHHRVTLELVAAILLALGVGLWLSLQLRRADTQAKVLVRDAYDTVAGVRDEIALASQENTLESIAILDPTNAARHFAEFADYDTTFQQGLCGSALPPGSGCVADQFTGGADTISRDAVTRALDGQNRFGLVRTPLTGNVRFAGEARALEAARGHYRAFLAADRDLQSKVGNNISAAVQTNAGVSQTEFQATVDALDQARAAARRVYDRIWHSVTDAAVIGEYLAGAEIVVALLIASGLWRRRQGLFVAR